MIRQDSLFSLGCMLDANGETEKMEKNPKNGKRAGPPGSGAGEGEGVRGNSPIVVWGLAGWLAGWLPT